MDILIQHKLIDGKGLFYVGRSGSIEAELVYSEHPGRMIIEHTEVNGSLTGKGVGLKLVQTAIEYARKNNLKIVPLCSFAKKVFDTMPQYKDVL